MARYMVGMTYENNKATEKPDELLLFVYYGINSWDLPNEKAIECKCRIAPRKFESFYMAKPEKTRLIYWSSELGLRISKIELKEKKGLIRIDRDEVLNSALEEFRNNQVKAKKLSKSDVEMLEDIKGYANITEKAYKRGYSEYCYDWHTYINEKSNPPAMLGRME